MVPVEESNVDPPPSALARLVASVLIWPPLTASVESEARLPAPKLCKTTVPEPDPEAR